MSNEFNAVGWFEIYVSDMDRAQRFYETVMAVKLAELPAPDVESAPPVQMLSFPMEEKNDHYYGACGALAKMDGVEPGTGGTLVYFSCADCSKNESRVEAAGGKVLRPKFSLGHYGFISIVMDTEGNTIGLHSKA